MKIKEVIEFCVKQLNNIEEANLKVKILLMNILDVSKEYLLIHDNDEFPEEKKQELNEKIEKLKNNVPIQYITNNQSFFEMDFYVDENVLIPQPDTEILVEECIKICENVENFLEKKDNTNEKKFKILDLCTGSGIIGISLAKNIEKCKVFASDISKQALKVAQINSEKNCVDINFIKSDLFENINEKFDMIASNPPYIRTNVIETLSKEVQKEPHLALDGGEDGLDFYKKIIKESKNKLEKNGYLVLEIGFDQKEDVIQILKENEFKNIYSKKDFGGNDRIVVAQK